MGVYYDLIVKTKRGNRHIQTLKYSIGVGLYAFTKDSFVCIPKEKYFAEATIKEALHNLDAFKMKLIDAMSTSHLDEWCENTCKTRISQIQKMIETLERFDDNDKLFSDMSEGVINIEGTEDVYVKNPAIDFEKNTKYVLDVASGNYNGVYTDINITEKQDEYITSVLKELAKKENDLIKVQWTGTSDNVRAINMGNNRIFKCSRTFVFKKNESLSEYDTDYYYIPVFSELQKKGIFVENNFEKTYVTLKENEIAFKWTMYWS